MLRIRQYSRRNCATVIDSADKRRLVDQNVSVFYCDPIFASDEAMILDEEQSMDNSTEKAKTMYSTRGKTTVDVSHDVIVAELKQKL